jgi:hypothetical protein
MKNKYEHFQDFLEWEIIDEDIQITNLSFEKGLYKLNKDCIIPFLSSLFTLAYQEIDPNSGGNFG